MYILQYRHVCFAYFFPKLFFPQVYSVPAAFAYIRCIFFLYTLLVFSINPISIYNGITEILSYLCQTGDKESGPLFMPRPPRTKLTSHS